MNLTDELRKLSALHAEGHLTDAEFTAAKQRLILVNYLIKVAQQSVNAAKELQKGGEGSLTDVLLLENELQRAYTELDQAKTMLEGELRQLSAMVGVRDLVLTWDKAPDAGNPPSLAKAYIIREVEVSPASAHR